jgi:hypothetical protein
MAPAGSPSITVRVEMPELWDTVSVAAAPDTAVGALKSHTLAVLYPTDEQPDEFVMKLRGFEVFDENASLAALGAVDGSIFLLTHRRRRPVR